MKFHRSCFYIVITSESRNDGLFILQLSKIISNFAVQSSDCRHITKVFFAVLTRKSDSFQRIKDKRIALISCIYREPLYYTGVG